MKPSAREERQRQINEWVGTSVRRWWIVTVVFVTSRMTWFGLLLLVAWWGRTLVPRAPELVGTLFVLYWTHVLGRYSQMATEAARAREEAAHLAAQRAFVLGSLNAARGVLLYLHHYRRGGHGAT